MSDSMQRKRSTGSSHSGKRSFAGGPAGSVSPGTLPASRQPVSGANQGERLSTFSFGFASGGSLEFDEPTSTTDSHTGAPHKVTPGMRLARWLDFVVNCVIILNTLQLGICVKTTEGIYNDTCEIANHVFVAVFLVEMALKLYMVRLPYLKDPWHLLDVTLALAGAVDWILTPVLGEKGGAPMKFFKLVRILRIIKLLRRFRPLRIILEGFLGALKGMIWVGFLLFMLIYVGAVFGVTCFSEVEPIDESMLTFATVPEAMFTMFSLAIVAEWEVITGPVLVRYKWAWVFFVVFVFTASFGILNLVIGVITERSAAVAQEYARADKTQEDLKLKRNLNRLADRIFGDKSDITKEEMQEALLQGQAENDQKLSDLLQKLPLPDGWVLTDCFGMFDLDNTDDVSKGEFVHGMVQLLFSSPVQQNFMIQGAISTLRERIHRIDLAMGVPSNAQRSSDAHSDRNGGDIVEEVRKYSLNTQTGVIAIAERLSSLEASLIQKMDLTLDRLEEQSRQEACAEFPSALPGVFLEGPRQRNLKARQRKEEAKRSTCGRSPSPSMKLQACARLVEELRDVPQVRSGVNQMQSGMADILALLTELREEAPAIPGILGFGRCGPNPGSKLQATRPMHHIAPQVAVKPLQSDISYQEHLPTPRLRPGCRQRGEPRHPPPPRSLELLVDAMAESSDTRGKEKELLPREASLVGNGTEAFCAKTPLSEVSPQRAEELLNSVDRMLRSAQAMQTDRRDASGKVGTFDELSMNL